MSRGTRTVTYPRVSSVKRHQFIDFVFKKIKWSLAKSSSSRQRNTISIKSLSNFEDKRQMLGMCIRASWDPHICICYIILYHIIFYSILFYSILLCSILFYFIMLLYYIYYIIFYYVMLCYVMLYSILFYFYIEIKQFGESYIFHFIFVLYQFLRCTARVKVIVYWTNAIAKISFFWKNLWSLFVYLFVAAKNLWTA